MKSIGKLRERAESVAYRLEMYFYLLLTVVLPVAFICLIGMATAGVLDYRTSPSVPLGGLAAPSWLSGWAADAFGSMDPVSRTIAIGLAALGGIVALVTIAMHVE